MTELNSMIAGDLDLCFADWGKTVTLRRVSEVFDPVSQLINETYDDASAVAIPGHASIGLTDGTAGQHFAGEASFFVRAGEYPFALNVSNARLEYEDTWFYIEAVRECGADLLQLTCRRMETGPDED
ncbi:MAG: hypothetical protein CMJ46_04940 [Planctomyces sp.]|nr:hypothetical protein [Planctomyces sp.]